MMELGTKAPDFHLLDTVSKEEFSLPDANSAKAVVIMFICNHCPYVHHVNQKMVEIANSYFAKGAIFIGISSNDVINYPQDGPERMKETAQIEGYPFPYLYDETQEVAKAYGAECTPDFFVFDSDLKCVYRGRMDETRPNMGVPSGRDLTSALDAVLAGQKANEEQFPSMGCGIKWKN